MNLSLYFGIAKVKNCINKMNTGIIKTYIMTCLTLVSLILILAFSSCVKEGPATAVITVVTPAGVPIEGATVTMRQDTIRSPVTGTRASIYDQEITDVDGQVDHDFPLEAILNIDVKKDSKTASDYIRLEQAKTVQKTIVLK